MLCNMLWDTNLSAIYLIVVLRDDEVLSCKRDEMRCDTVASETRDCSMAGCRNYTQISSYV